MPENIPKILVVDDERLARKRVDEALLSIQQLFPHEVVGVCDNGADAWTLIQNEYPDIILLDIHMPAMTGLELAERIKLLPKKPHVIFLTAFMEHALHAFDADAVDYLLKPVREDRLLQALEKAHPRGALTTGHFHIPSQRAGSKIMLHIHDVLVASADWKYVKLLTAQDEYLTEITLQRLQEQYSEFFCRIHRSTLVNIMHVQTMEREGDDQDHRWVIRIRGLDQTFPISRRMVTDVKDRLKR